MSSHPVSEISNMQSAGFFTNGLAGADPEIAGWIDKELSRQRDKIELIASENITSRAVLEATGSILTNKYAEGYPGKRYYGGCEYVDEIETIAIERAKKLFGCGFANVQPNSGSQMNQAVFLALLQPGYSFMGLDIVSGGTDNHLMLVDLRPKQAKGKHAEQALDRASITCNKNNIPFDTEKAALTSGLRLGSPAGTTRGFGPAEFRDIGRMIADVVEGLRKNGEAGDGQAEARVKAQAEALCGRFPIYPGL